MTPSTAATLEPTTWSASAPHVRKAIAFIKRRGSITAEELVAWDQAHGRRLFEWTDEDAAAHWRTHQARVFLNSFRKMFDGMRVRAFIHIEEDALTEISESGYVSVEAIAEHTGMRAQVIDDIMRRMKMLASELKMWKLTPTEQAQLFERLADALSVRRKDEAA